MPLFIKRPQQSQIVEATQVGAGAQATVQGQRPARPGDWVVTDHSMGIQWIADDLTFNTEYVPLPVPGHLLAEGATTALMQSAVTAGGVEYPEADVTPRPPDVPGGGDQSPITQPISDALPGRPAPSPEVRPRLGEDTTVETPTGIPNQPGDADKAYHQETSDSDVGPMPPGVEGGPGPMPPSAEGSSDEEPLPA